MKFIRYGPITVNPRKRPSKTLFTGRRSKYEVLANDEEERRRLRRERNRVAATKCREKRESVLFDLEMQYNEELQKYTKLSNDIAKLEQRKQHLQSVFSNYIVNGSQQQIIPIPSQQEPPMVFGDPAFLTSIIETPVPPLPPHQLQNIQYEEDEFHNFLQPPPSLTNSAYNNIDQSNWFFTTEQQTHQTITMNSSSIDRLMNSLQSPTPFIDNNNNCSGLYNSAYGTSTCAQQHSSSSEDDSLPPNHKNSYVC
jgi:hypothetical protein